MEIAPVIINMASNPALCPIPVRTSDSENPRPVMFMTPMTMPAPPAIMSSGSMFAPPPTMRSNHSALEGSRRLRNTVSPSKATTDHRAATPGLKPRQNNR